jgi:hypothetical protein
MQIHEVVWPIWQAHGEWRKLQWPSIQPVLFCAVSSVQSWLRPSAQPAKGRYNESHRAQIKKWCKLERGEKAKGCKTGRKKELPLFCTFGDPGRGVWRKSFLLHWLPYQHECISETPSCANVLCFSGTQLSPRKIHLKSTSQFPSNVRT